MWLIDERRIYIPGPAMHKSSFAGAVLRNFWGFRLHKWQFVIVGHE
jgi:hypothetical protein